MAALRYSLRDRVWSELTAAQEQNCESTWVFLDLRC